MGYIDSTAVITDSSISDDARIYKNVILKSSTVSEKCIIGDFCRIEDTSLAYFAQIYPNGIVYSTDIGAYSYVQKNSSVWHAAIGKYCSVSWNVSIGGGEHDFHRVTTHSMLYSAPYGFVDEPLYDRFNKKCTIGNDVWIASGASILRGVTVGDGAVIGAGAIVTKDVEPYSIVAGVPAKKIGQRCSDELISEMLEIKWWDFPEDVIKRNIELFNEELTMETINRLKECLIKKI